MCAMCGRFTRTDEPRHIEMRFGATFITTRLLPVILGRNPLENSEHEIVLAKWGFQPAGAKHWHAQINARVETAREKPMFRHAFHVSHCLVLADSYFEWKIG